jgi:hypothetical protein
MGDNASASSAILAEEPASPAAVALSDSERPSKPRRGRVQSSPSAYEEHYEEHQFMFDYSSPIDTHTVPRLTEEKRGRNAAAVERFLQKEEERGSKSRNAAQDSRSHLPLPQEWVADDSGLDPYFITESDAIQPPEVDKQPQMNPKQSHRIQKRRETREKLQEYLASQPPLKPFRQHGNHAARRPRGPSGRFLTLEEVDAQAKDQYKDKYQDEIPNQTEFFREDLRDSFLTKVEEIIITPGPTGVPSEEPVRGPAGLYAKRPERILQATSIRFLNSPADRVCGEARAIADYQNLNEDEMSVTEGQYLWVSNQCMGSRLIAGNPKTQEIGRVPKEILHLIAVPIRAVMIPPKEEEASLLEPTKATLESTNLPTTSPMPTKPEHKVAQSQALPADQAEHNSLNTEEGKKAIAVLDFMPVSKRELILEKGQAIFVLDQAENCWSLAENAEHTKSGWVPSTHIKIEGTNVDERKAAQSHWPQSLVYSHSSSTSITVQRKGLWWQGYLALRIYEQSSIFLSLNETLSNEFGSLTSTYITDKDICARVSTLVSRAESATLNAVCISKLDAVLDARANIIRIAQTVESSLGLEVAMLGWSCVSVFLAVHLPSPLPKP